jgi:APA family basic amino acid/polyamine antiporter
LVAALLSVTPAAGTSAGPPAHPPAAILPGFMAIVVALQLVLGAYDGWQSAIYFAEEDRRPERNIPRSLVGGVLLVMGVYLLVNVAVMRVLDFEALATSSLPAADAARSLLGARGDTAVTALALLSLLTLMSAVLLCAPRILYAMSRDGLLSARIASVSRGGTPDTALLLSAGAAMALVSTRTFESIASVFAVFSLTSYSGGFASLLMLRRREPDLPRPFRSWGFPWTTVVVLAGAMGLLAGLAAAAPRESLIAAMALVVGFVVRKLTRRSG